MSYTKNEIALETFISNVNSFFYYVGEDDDLIPFPRYEIRERLDKYVSQFMQSIEVGRNIMHPSAYALTLPCGFVP